MKCQVRFLQSKMGEETTELTPGVKTGVSYYPETKEAEDMGAHECVEVLYPPSLFHRWGN